MDIDMGLCSQCLMMPFRNKTLNGGRAERNEYILLHEFHRLKYICPDKTYGKKFTPKAEEGEEVGKSGKAKRNKYKGGRVLEPKRGLWDKYVLVMDFNSLYPSIIQEYNIDFTTVERIDEQFDEVRDLANYAYLSTYHLIVQDGEEVHPEPPSSNVPQGVLPRLIASLVDRRRGVKALMKDKTATPAQLLQVSMLH